MVVGEVSFGFEILSFKVLVICLIKMIQKEL